MKKSEKLLDIIGQIDDRLVEEAEKAGFAGDGKVESFGKVSRKKTTGKKGFRWQGALAACAVLAICIGIFGILERSGLLLSPFAEKNTEQIAEDAALPQAAEFAEEAVGEAAQKGAPAEEAKVAAEEDAPAEAAEEGAAAEAAEEDALAEAAEEDAPAEAAEEDAPAEAAEEDAAEAAEVGAPAAAGKEGALTEAAAEALQEADAGASVTAMTEPVGYCLQQEEGTQSAKEGEHEKNSRLTGTKTEEVTSQGTGSADVNGLIVTILDSSADDVTYLLENTGSREITYGAYAVLERFTGDNWKTVEPQEGIAWNDLLYALAAGEAKEESVQLAVIYGTLDSGSYRLVKDYQVSGEEAESYQIRIAFTIEE